VQIKDMIEVGLRVGKLDLMRPRTRRRFSMRRISAQLSASLQLALAQARMLCFFIGQLELAGRLSRRETVREQAMDPARSDFPFAGHLLAVMRSFSLAMEFCGFAFVGFHLLTPSLIFAGFFDQRRDTS
jgi:hypothetical protein